MRSVLLFLLVPTLASAEPSSDTGAYVGLDGVAGVSISRDSFVAAGVEGGYQIGATPLWLHAGLIDGVGPLQFGLNLSDRSISYLELRGGLEARSCFAGGVVCPIGGIDLGFHRENVVVNTASFENGEAIAVGRVGLDVGARNLRFRPELDVGVGTDGGTTESFVLGVAYRW